MSDEDPGRPLRSLAGLEHPAPAGLLDRVRNAIQRRQLAADVVDLSLMGPARLFLEYLRALVEGILGLSTNDDEDPS